MKVPSTFLSLFLCLKLWSQNDLQDTTIAKAWLLNLGKTDSFVAHFPSLEEMHWYIKHQYWPVEEESAQLLRANNVHQEAVADYQEALEELQSIYSTDYQSGSTIEIVKCRRVEEPGLRLTHRVCITYLLKEPKQKKPRLLYMYFTLARINKQWRLLEIPIESDQDLW